MLVDEQLICGLQIHVGVSDRDLAVEIMQRVARDLPDPARPLGQLALLERAGHRLRQHPHDHLAALAERRRDRPAALGPREYDEMLADLINTGVIADAKMAYFDVRPSAHAPTLELRTCDACPIVDDAVLIAGLFRATVLAAEQEITPGARSSRCRRRSTGRRSGRPPAAGLSGVLLDDTRHPKPLPATQAVRAPAQAAAPAAGGAGRLGRGPGAGQDRAGPRQLRRPAARRVRRTGSTRATWSSWWSARRRAHRAVPSRRCPRCAGTATAPATRRSGPSIRPRPVYHDLIDTSGASGRRLARSAKQAAVDWIDEHGMTFGVGGEKRRFSVDLMPRVISPHEWETPGPGPDPAGPSDRDLPARRLRRAADRWPTGCCPASWW